MAATRRWKLRWPAIYPAIGIVILWHQTFVAQQAQPWLVIPAIALMGIQIPINYAKALQVLAEHSHDANGDDGDSERRVDAQR